MNDIQRYATILWHAINEQLVSSANVNKVFSLLTNDVSKALFNDADMLTNINYVFSHQPSTSILVRKWRNHFSENKTLTAPLALQFVNEVLASLEDIDDLFVNDILSGQTSMRKHGMIDYTTKRVMRKKRGWSLHLTVKGKGHYNCVRQQLITEPGDLVLISPDGIYDYHRDEKSHSWSHQWIYFCNDESWARWLRWPDAGPGIFHIRTAGANYRTLRELFLETIALSKKTTPYLVELQKNLTEQILIRCYQLLPKEKTKVLNGKIAVVTLYIAEHYMENFDLQQLADHVCLSRPRLSALFKEQTGTSIMRWRDEKRISKACELLSSTSTPISRIAEMVGYSDPLYFSRIFHQHLNCSPREYRRRRANH